MAAPLPKEDKAKIVDYLRQQDLWDLTGVKIKELIKEDLGINISQPTASKLKGEILEDNSDDREFTGDDSSLSEETDAVTELTNPDNIRQLSQEQMNAIDYLLKGQSDRAAAEVRGSRVPVELAPARALLQAARARSHAASHREAGSNVRAVSGNSGSCWGAG